MSFCLVTMPYSRIELSSVALGLLQATLKRDGLEARSIYANILFAEKIGTLAYTRVSLFRPRLGVAEWTFAHIAFPEFSPDINEYLKLVMTVNEVYASIDRNELEDLRKAQWYVSREILRREKGQKVQRLPISKTVK